MNTRGILDVIEQTRLPVIVEGGLRTPSDCAKAMELGADCVLVNAAIVRASNQVEMAKAVSRGVQAGRAAYLAQPMAAA